MSGAPPWPESSLLPATWGGVRRQLERCIELADAGTLPGTLMLVGEPGLGREALALELAAALVCRSRPTQPCACSSCERARRGTHPDVVVIDVQAGKTEISIEQARALVETLPQRPYEGTRRVFVIASCHTPPLNLEAASALLKALEEPPGHVHLVLLAANTARVLPTVVSRSVQLRVAPPTPAEVEGVLATCLGVPKAKVALVLEACHGDTALALATGDTDAVSASRALAELLSGALSGDGLALLRLAGQIKGLTGGVALAVASSLTLARDGHPESAEAVLDAAAALLAAAKRQEALHTDLEAGVLGALAPLSRE